MGDFIYIFGIILMIIGTGVLSAHFFDLYIRWRSRWKTHKSMMEDDLGAKYNKYGTADFSRFKEEFKKYDWMFNRKYKKSLFGKNRNTRIHAGRIIFEGKGMLIENWREYRKVREFVQNYIENNFEDEIKKDGFDEDLWNESVYDDGLRGKNVKIIMKEPVL